MLTRLPHRVSLMTESRTTFTGGAYSTSWVSVSAEWANCQRVRVGSSESNEYLKRQQLSTWQVVMRKNSNITNKNRLHFGSVILHIELVQDPTARGRVVYLQCSEEVI